MEMQTLSTESSCQALPVESAHISSWLWHHRKSLSTVVGVVAFAAACEALQNVNKGFRDFVSVNGAALWIWFAQWGVALFVSLHARERAQIGHKTFSHRFTLLPVYEYTILAKKCFLICAFLGCAIWWNILHHAGYPNGVWQWQLWRWVP